MKESYRTVPGDSDLFDDVSGMSASSPIYANGFRVGVVQRIEFDYDHPGHIVAAVDIDPQLRLTEGSRAEIASDFLGNVKLELLLGPANGKLLNKGDKCVAELPTDKNGRADFFFLKPAEYYLRCFIDGDANGVWSTGEYVGNHQPERVFYFPKPLQVKAKWDVEQDWAPLSIPRIGQKPLEITKQKPDKQKDVKQRNKDREWKKQQEKRERRGE